MPTFCSHTSLGPFFGQGVTIPFSAEVLSPRGPRKPGQSSPCLRVPRSAGGGSSGPTFTVSSAEDGEAVTTGELVSPPAQPASSTRTQVGLDQATKRIGVPLQRAPRFPSLYHIRA